MTKQTHREAGTSFLYPFPQYRVQRVDGKLVPISSEDWNTYEWIDVTSMEDPCDTHVYVSLGRLDRR